MKTIKTKGFYKKENAKLRKQIELMAAEVAKKYVPRDDLLRLYAGMRIAITETVGEEELAQIIDKMEDLSLEQIFKKADPSLAEQMSKYIELQNQSA